MRKINKQLPIDSFNRFIKDGPTLWSEIHLSENQHVYKESRDFILINEQNGMCGYTELPLSEDDKDIHIDHYKKRDLFPRETFDWNNLIVALKSDEFGADYKDSRYHIKKEEYSQILNPATDIAQDYFEYLATGDIRPKPGLTPPEKLKAERTIEVFNLNHASLVNRRKDLVRMIDAYKGVPKEIVASCIAPLGFKSLQEQESL